MYQTSQMAFPGPERDQKGHKKDTFSRQQKDNPLLSTIYRKLHLPYKGISTRLSFCG